MNDEQKDKPAKNVKNERISKQYLIVQNFLGHPLEEGKVECMMKRWGEWPPQGPKAGISSTQRALNLKIQVMISVDKPSLYLTA